MWELQFIREERHTNDGGKAKILDILVSKGNIAHSILFKHFSEIKTTEIIYNKLSFTGCNFDTVESYTEIVDNIKVFDHLLRHTKALHSDDMIFLDEMLDNMVHPKDFIHQAVHV